MIQEVPFWQPPSLGAMEIGAIIQRALAPYMDVSASGRPRCDSGGGMGQRDLLPVIGGVEYKITIAEIGPHPERQR